MAQLTNDALYEILAADAWPIGDDIYLFAGAPTSQSGGGPVKGCVHRIVLNNQAAAALVMKSILSNDCPQMVWILNDGAQAAAVFCFPGEKMNGSANGSFSVTAGNAAVFAAIPTQIKRKGGGSGGGTLDWRPALIS